MMQKRWPQGVKFRSVCAYWLPQSVGASRVEWSCSDVSAPCIPALGQPPMDFSLLSNDEKNSFTLIYFLGFHKRKALGVLFPCQLCKKHCCRLGDLKHYRLNSLEIRSEL